MRALLVGMICLATLPAHAGTVDDIQKAIFNEGGTKIKPGYRWCNSDSNCAAALILCRWRAVNKESQKSVSETAGKAALECKWPKPPATPPIARCVENLCDILPDGKYY